MALAATLYRFKLELSDIDRAVYESIDVRMAMHPSESQEFLLTRLLAFALNYEDGLKFSEGLSTPDVPAIQLNGPHGEIVKWIDIGNPTAKRLHKASKAAKHLRVYTYKNIENLKKEALSETIHQVDQIEVFSFEPEFLASLGQTLKRDNSWGFIHEGGEIVITVADDAIIGRATLHRLDAR